jgi:hypothetical protein
VVLPKRVARMEIGGKKAKACCWWGGHAETANNISEPLGGAPVSTDHAESLASRLICIVGICYADKGSKFREVRQLVHSHTARWL